MIQPEYGGASPLLVLGRREHVRAARGCRNAGGNLGRTSQEFRARGYVEGVQTLMVIRGGVQRHGDQVNGAVRTGAAVDDRRGSYADLGHDLIAAERTAGVLAGFQQGYLPKRGAAIGVKGIDRIVLGGHEYHVVRDARDAELRQVQWLGIDLAIHGHVAQQTKARGIDVRGGQYRFRGVRTAAVEVVLVSRHVRSRATWCGVGAAAGGRGAGGCRWRGGCGGRGGCCCRGARACRAGRASCRAGGAGGSAGRCAGVTTAAGEHGDASN